MPVSRGGASFELSQPLARPYVSRQSISFAEETPPSTFLCYGYTQGKKQKNNHLAVVRPLPDPMCRGKTFRLRKKGSPCQTLRVEAKHFRFSAGTLAPAFWSGLNPRGPRGKMQSQKVLGG